MFDTITVPRVVVERALEALNASMPHNNDMDGDWPSHIAARRALRAALEQPQDHFPDAGNRVPTGWKLVPIEPTLEMSIAFGESFYTQDRCLDDDKISDWWGDMLAAAPQPPAVKESLTVRPQVEQEPVAWAEEIIEYLHAHYDTEMIKELDSGDALIRLDDAIAAVEEVEQRYTHPQTPRQPLTHEWIRMIYDECDAETGDEFVFAFARDIERAHGITGEQA